MANERASDTIVRGDTPPGGRRTAAAGSDGRAMVVAAECGRNPVDWATQMSGIQIRPLGPDDAEVYQQLRLRGLRENSEAFGLTLAEDAAVWLAVVGDRLKHVRTLPSRVVLGAWRGAELVGVVGCIQQAKQKTRHTAVVWGTYVAPEARGMGVGRLLLEQLLSEVRGWKEVARLTLSVVERAESARRLYAAVGFTEFGREADAFRENGVRDTALHLALSFDET